MAEGGTSIPDPEKWEKIKGIRNLRELFRGRFTYKEANKLMRMHEWNLGRTVQAVFNASPGDLRDLLKSNTVNDRISIVTRNDVLKDLARRNEIAYEIRQYVCTDCERMWWRRVPVRKPVSRCFGCQTKFDPVPRNREWGTGEFECECGLAFKGKGVMGQTKRMCNRCGRMCPILRILPPNRGGNRSSQPPNRGGNQTGRRRNNRGTHSCNAHNCFNRKGRADPNIVCIDPRSNPIRYLPGSEFHASTGSTVNTFLDQDDIEPAYEPSLADIVEEDEQE